MLGGVGERAVTRLVESWDRWVSELEDHPLDRFEYDELKAIRDSLVEALVIAGEEMLWDAVDEIDVRFRAITVAVKAGGAEEPWWHTRLPKSKEARQYLADGAQGTP
jgi:hypothetical protein